MSNKKYGQPQQELGKPNSFLCVEQYSYLSRKNSMK